MAERGGAVLFLHLGKGFCQGRDIYLRCAHLAGLGANHINRLPRIINKQTFTGRMTLTHHRRQLAFPAGVKFAVPAVAIPVRVAALSAGGTSAPDVRSAVYLIVSALTAGAANMVVATRLDAARTLKFNIRAPLKIPTPEP